MEDIVYSMISTDIGVKKIIVSHDYQKKALREYISNNEVDLVQYKLNNYIFSINKCSICYLNLNNLDINLDDIYIFIREDGTYYPISKNKEKLLKITIFINK